MRSDPKTLPASVPPRKAMRRGASAADEDVGASAATSSATDTAHLTRRTGSRYASTGAQTTDSSEGRSASLDFDRVAIGYGDDLQAARAIHLRHVMSLRAPVVTIRSAHQVPVAMPSALPSRQTRHRTPDH